MFSDLIRKRRSVRKYSGEALRPEDVEMLLKAALLSPASKSSNCWEFVVVEDKEMLLRLSECKAAASKLIAGAAVAIVVLGDAMKSDVWIEDASVASLMIQLQAEDLGLGSCWVQIRERETADGLSSEDYVRDLLDIPLSIQVLSIIAIGRKLEDKAPHDESELQWEKIHLGKW